MMIFTLARRELRSLFLSPLAWSILAIVQFIMAYLFLSQLQEFILIQPKLATIENAPGVTEWYDRLFVDLTNIVTRSAKFQLRGAR